MSKFINIKKLAISSIIWGILFFAYNMFYPISVFDLLGADYFFYSIQEKDNLKLILNNTASILNLVFTILLITISILLLITYIKNTTQHILSGILLILLGLILTLVNLPFISWLPVIIGGIFILMYQNE